MCIHIYIYTRSDSKLMSLILFLAVLSILRPANRDSRLPLSFLYTDLQWHGFAVTHCGVGARRVKTCLRTSSRKWKHGISLSGMPSFFCVKLGDSATATHGKLQQAFGDDAMSRAQAFHWHKMFSEGRNIAEYKQCSGRPPATRTSDNTARVRELVRSDRRLAVKIIVYEVKVNREAVRRILTEELGMRKIWTKKSDRATAGCAGERLC